MMIQRRCIEIYIFSNELFENRLKEFRWLWYQHMSLYMKINLCPRMLIIFFFVIKFKVLISTKHSDFNRQLAFTFVNSFVFFLVLQKTNTLWNLLCLLNYKVIQTHTKCTKCFHYFWKVFVFSRSARK